MPQNHDQANTPTNNGSRKNESLTTESPPWNGHRSRPG